MHIAIIGTYGSAGVAVANRLSSNVGDEIDRISLIDGGKPGGLCILNGCMPSKAVLSSAKHAHEANREPRLDGSVTVNTEKTIEHKDEYIESFADHRGEGVNNLAELEGIELINANARFESENKLMLDNGDTLNPDYTVVATGSKLNIPELDGLEETDYLTSSDILDMKSLPESVVVMGFGAIGMEMSAYMAASGVDVTVIEHDDTPIDDGSNIFGTELVNIYEEEFDVEILRNTYEEKVEEMGEKVRLHIDSEEEYIEAEELCVFTGRVPNTDGLNIKTITGEDRISVGDGLRITGTNTVFVAGDVTGDRMILHIAKEQGELVADNIISDIKGEKLEEFGSEEHLVYFTGCGKYPFSRYGVTADEARNREDLIAVQRRASDDGIFSLKEAGHGVSTLSVEKRTETVKGYEGLHLHSDVMVKTMQVLIENEVDVRDVPSRAYHPTTPELLDGLIRDAVERLD